MKITIKSNGVITSAHVQENKTNPDNIDFIEFDFTPSPIFSDLEMWLEDENGKLLDHVTMNRTKRGKLRRTR